MRKYDTPYDVCSSHCLPSIVIIFFFFNDTATTEIYTLSLHDALPIWDLRQLPQRAAVVAPEDPVRDRADRQGVPEREDRKSTRLNSSHLVSRMPSSA